MMTLTLTSSAHVSSTSIPSTVKTKEPVSSEVVNQSIPQEISEQAPDSDEAQTSEQLRISVISDQSDEVEVSQGEAQFKSRLNMFRRSLARSKRIGGEYKIVRKIDEGSYGVVYKVIDRNGRFYAAKIAKCPTLGFTLRTEQKLILPAVRGKIDGQVSSYYKGRHVGCRVIVMDLLGRSVKKQFLRYRPLSIHTILLFGVQATLRIEELHRRGYVHRDVKPSNFAVGHKEDSGTIYLIDFGLAERFRSARGRKHVTKRSGLSFTGSKDFAARASHKGETQSRSCDLESIVYAMVFLREGRLRWTSHSEETAGQMKEEISASQLCSKLPDEVADYYRIVRSLGFQERPNYSKLRDILVRAMERRGLDIHGKFDWEG